MSTSHNRRSRTSRKQTKALATPAFEALEQRRMMAYYYVSPTSGNDNWAGTSTTKPFKTLAKLNTVNLQAGDTVCLQSGVTHNGKLYFDSNDKGALATPITVQPWGAGRPTISSGTEFGVFAWNTAGIVIKDLNVYGSGATNTSGGIFFYNDRADGAKLEGITITNVDVNGYK